MLRGVAVAQDEALVIPVRVVNGHLVVLTELVGLHGSNRVSFEISFAQPETLTLHADQHEWLGADHAAPITPVHITLRIEPDVEVSIPFDEIKVESSDERIAVQNEITKLYSAGLNEHKLKGTIGIGLLKKYQVSLDIPEKQLILAPPQAPGERSSLADAADVVSPFAYTNNRVHIPIAYADNRKGHLAIGGADYDTFIDAALAGSLNRLAGNVQPVWLLDPEDGAEKLDLSRHVAFRPRAFDDLEDVGRPVLIAGVNVLEQFRLELDWTNQTIAFTHTRARGYPQPDFEFFQAQALGTSEAMLAYLVAHPRDRLSPDAARLLVQWRVDKDHAGDEEVMTAVKWLVDTSLPGRRAESCLFYVEMFRTLPDRAALTMATANEGLAHAREAFDPRAVYALHNALGELFMKEGDLTNAWKHFLSVAFMMPDDIMVNLNLARVYDRQGRARRAYSRYKRVAAAPNLGPLIDEEVSAALERLGHQLSADDVLLMDEKAPRKPGA